MENAIRKLAFIWIALLLLLIVTIGSSRFDLKGFNVSVSLVVAFAKMLLIVLYFMELRSSSKSLWVIASAGIVWLLIFFSLTITDYVTRGYSWSQ
jgi:cytochrome c oxidase subunit 4